jgi:hypothetical protein
MLGPGITAIVRFGRLTEMLKSVGVKPKVHCVVLRKASFPRCDSHELPGTKFAVLKYNT